MIFEGRKSATNIFRMIESKVVIFTHVNLTAELYQRAQMCCQTNLTTKLKEILLHFRTKGSLQRRLPHLDENGLKKELFHGTKHEYVDAICKQNFDWRINGDNATVYGKGSYFAVEASYSHNYTNENEYGSRFIFLVDVLVGEYTKVLRITYLSICIKLAYRG